jgi:hypothetical protein
MKTDKKKLKEEETIEYLKEILLQHASIFNPMKLDIPKFGKVLATSMVNYHYDEGKLIPYFTFRKNRRESGEFLKENDEYFIRYYENGGKIN